MFLKSLRTENFKKLGTFSCTFTGGLNVIAGDNAQGKSTLLQAIQVAFYGPSVVPGKAENIPTWGSKNFSVHLCFDHDGASYELTRSKTTAKLVQVDGDSQTLKANGSTPVTAFITEMLGIDAKDYDLFIQSRQGSSAGMLVFGATALNRKVEEFAGADLIDAVKDRAAKKASAAQAKAESLEVPEEQQQALGLALADCRRVEQGATEALRDAVHAKDALPAAPTRPEGPSSIDMQKEASAAAQMLSKLEGLEGQLASARQALASHQDSVGEVPKDPSQLKADMASSASKGEALKAQLKALEDQGATYDSLKAKAESAKADAERATEALREAEQCATEAGNQSDLASVSKDADEALKRCQETRAERSQRLAQLKGLAGSATCPTCGQATADHDPVALAAEVEEARQALHEAEASLKEAEEAASAARRALNSAAEAAGELKRCKQRTEEAASVCLEASARLLEVAMPDPDAMAELEAGIDEERKVWAGLNADLRQLSQQLEAWQRAKDGVTKWEKEVQRLEGKVADLEKQYEELPEPPTPEQILEKADQEIKFSEATHEWSEKTNLAAMLVQRRTSDLTAAELATKQAQQKVNEAFDRDNQSKAAAAQASQYDRLVRLLRDRRVAYLQGVWQVVMSVATRLVTEASGGAITGVDNRDGEFWYEEQGTWAPVSSASGAQRSFIGVNLRIALTRALYGSDSAMMFDEPTESCSERNASGMTATLAAAAKQVLLITHRESDQVLAENVISVGE